MKLVLNVYKPMGLTPLQVINKVKKAYPKYKNKKIGYAGRLDPMAHGVLILLVEPETKNRSKYQNLDKEYEFEVLFGIETDTYDALGLIQNSKTKTKNLIYKTKFNKEIDRFKGIHKQKYPPYSSKTVNGKPLYWWARNNKLKEITVPEKEVKIYSIELVKVREIPKDALSKKIVHNINLTSGDFRQDEILKKWNKYFEVSKIQKYQTAKFKIKCSSGTYVRAIAQEIGKKLECGAITIEILRTSVGNYAIKNSIRL